MKTSILMVDDDEAFRGVMAAELRRQSYVVTTVASAEEALRSLERTQPDVVLLDLRLPDKTGLEVLPRIRELSPASEVIMLTGHGSIDSAIEAVRAGAFDYVTKPCPLDELEVRIQRSLERQALRRRTSLLERGLTPADPAASFVGDSPEFRRLVGLVERVAVSDSTVLIGGETGCGKGVVARLLHARGSRSQRPFVVVECAALQEGLLQSELFGHERGAFTGADRAKPGLFEVAHGGTIFLDEIGEISPATQVSLLRVLDTATFRHVGGTSEIQVDVRVLAATNRDLAGLVRQGRFRSDLFYRLNTVSITIPPLRTRATDIPVLIAHYVRVFNERFGVRKRIGAAASARLQRHDWPGNVRELLHVVEGALVMCEGDEVGLEHLPTLGQGSPRGPDGEAAGPEPLGTLAELERAHVERVLRAVAGHRGQAARVLGISERNLYRKLSEYSLLE
ncbi:MAG: sigma-54 dependent transcriptional regulator [Vicinamibacteria bacterium]|nr:sigma-54 dependent transcriptional regulator [Vicinamibacteria bacterium]